ncbi:ABC transporter permease [Intrasporangium sp. DVR]|uniref:ABC transporter permease n=1 Tax=Intrasporangium sp. DVR TaxID=3127867 RepID=UPI00313A5F5F
MTRLRPVLALTGAELRRFLRDRSNIFFVFIFPLLLVVVIGAQFGSGSSSGRVSIAGEDGPLRRAVVAALQSDRTSVASGDWGDIVEEVSRGRTTVGLQIPDGANAAFAAGQPVELEMLPSSQSAAMAVQQAVRAAIEQVQLDGAQISALVSRGVPPEAAAESITAARSHVTAPTVRVEDVDRLAQEFSGLGQFDLGASSMVLLFTFLSSLTGATTLIQARRQGVIARALAAPVSTSQVLLGQAAGRFTIALFQAVYIVVATGILFGVDWGSPWLTGLVLISFSAVSAGAAMVLGAVLDNEGAASGIGVGVGLVLAGLGGGMVPLELFTDTLRSVSKVTPHSWAYEAFAEIQRHDASFVDILPQLGALTGMAVVALVVGAWALRRSVARAM